MLKKIFVILSLAIFSLQSHAYPDVQLLTCFRTEDENNIDLNFERLNVEGYDLVDGDITIDTDAGTGANTLDTGSLTNDTWYAIHVIYNPSIGTKAGLISLSRTSPTLPEGYTVFRAIGWCHTNPTATTIRKFHYDGGGWWNYDQQYTILSGGVQTSWTAIDCSGYAPVTSQLLSLCLLCTRAVGLSEVISVKATGDTGQYGFSYFQATGATIISLGSNTICPCNTSQSIDYKIYSAANSGTGTIYLSGYQDNSTPV